MARLSFLLFLLPLLVHYKVYYKGYWWTPAKTMHGAGYRRRGREVPRPFQTCYLLGTSTCSSNSPKPCPVGHLWRPHETGGTSPHPEVTQGCQPLINSVAYKKTLIILKIPSILEVLCQETGRRANNFTILQPTSSLQTQFTSIKRRDNPEDTGSIGGSLSAISDECTPSS